MTWQLNLYAIPIILTTLPLGYCAQLAWRGRAKLPERLFLALTAVMLWLTVIYSLRLVSADPAVILWLVKLEYPANLLSVVLWLLFLLAYVGYDQLITRRTIGLLSIFPLFYMAVVWTNDFHHLHWAYTGITWFDSLMVFQYSYSYSPAFWLSIGYIYLLMLAGTTIIVHKLARAPAIFQQQSRTLLIAALLPWGATVIDVAGLNPLPIIDMNVFMLVISISLLAWSLFRHRLLDLAPAAHDMIVRSISDAVLVLDLDQRIVEANPAATALLASPTPRLIGRPVQELFAEVAALLTRSPSSHEVYEEITAKRGQTIRRLEIRSSPLRSQWGQARGRVVIVRDISEQKRAEEQATQLALEQAKVRMMSEFIDNASHDLNTPLTTLRISTDLLKVYTTRLPKPINTLRTLLRDTAADETLAQLEKLVQSVLINGERVNESTLRLQRLVSEMLEMVRLDKQLQLQPEASSLNDVARAVIQKAEQRAVAKQLTLCLEPHPTLPCAIFDQQKLEQAVQHLVSNAITYTPAGGTVRIRTSQLADRVILEVADDGIGIAPADLPLIFERFYRADKARSLQTGGMGLGLAIVKLIVEAHHGQIEVESELGRGSTFRICLPLPSPVVAYNGELALSPTLAQRRPPLVER